MVDTPTAAPDRAHPPATPPPPTEIVLVHWPADAAAREAARAAGHACLLLVEPGQRPPETWTDLEDWLRLPADPAELHTRRQALAARVARRAPAWIDGDGLLRRGDRWVALSPIEVRALGALLARPGALVAREVLVRAVEGVASPSAAETRAFDHAMQRLRRRVAPFGLDVCTVRGVGYLLEIDEAPL